MINDNVTHQPEDDRGTAIRGLSDTLAYLKTLEPLGEELDMEPVVSSSLASHIIGRYQKFSDAKLNSGVTQSLVDDAKAYENEYSAEDLARIKDFGSSIFMGLTATKCRAGMSWIRDVLLQPHGERFEIESTPVPHLPPNVLKQIEGYFTEELKNGTNDPETGEEPKDAQGQPPPEGGTGQLKRATDKVRKLSELKRDIKDALYEETKAQADHELTGVKRIIQDDLVTGDWDTALNDFITDFCIYRTAFIKAPIVSKEPRLTWVNGEQVVNDRFIYNNKRVSPFDIYPDPSTDCLNKGDVIEHLRLSRSEVRSLIGIPKYNDEKLREVLEVGSGFTSFFDSRIEFDKAELENRGTEFDMNEDVIHGIHFHGGVDGQKLISWGVEDSKIDKNDLTKVYEVEAVLLNHEVVKCVLNSDPLGRRPYLHASYQKTPGSVWGRSIPTLMRDVQRMCNACARALADNMGLSSGPQVEIYVDRLADSGPIEEMEPRKIWQLKSDPTGAGGRAIQFTDVPSNAQELLLVYQDFEMKADDITGIPRYAYGNEKTAGAATTAKGLAMLLESASKGIKDAIRNIDLGVIIPRIEMQFYYTMVTRKDLKYTGDIDIVTYGSEAIILKAAREAKRAEFIQITSNPIDQKIMGWAGRGDILREMSEDLGFPHNLIPSRLELKKLEIEEKAMEKKRLEIEAQKQSVGLQAVQAQSASNEKIAGQRTAVEMKKLEQNQMEASARSQLKLIELKAAKENALGKIGADLQKTKLKEDAQDRRTNKNLAVDILQTNNMRRQNVERGYR